MQKRTPRSSYLIKDVKEAILLQLPKPNNINPVKKLDDILLELLKERKNIWTLVWTAHLKR